MAINSGRISPAPVIDSTASYFSSFINTSNVTHFESTVIESMLNSTTVAETLNAFTRAYNTHMQIQGCFLKSIIIYYVYL